MKELPSTITTLIIGIAITLISVWYGQHNGLLPADASGEAPLIDGLFNAMLAISTGLFLLIQGALVVSLFRFRRRKDDNTDAAPVHGNLPLEFVWTAIPAIIVLWLAIYSFDVYKSVDSGGFEHVHNVSSSAEVSHAPHADNHVAYAAPSPAAAELESKTQPGDQADPQVEAKDVSDVAAPRQAAQGQGASGTGELTIDVTGLRYAWLFKYPGTEITTAELHVPTGRRVKLNLSAQDVIHAFWVPEFRLKQDTVPGQETHLRFTPKTLGQYPIICAELCGPYHGAMKSQVIVQTPEDYQAWLQEQTASADDLSQTVAINPAAQSPSEFLAPYASKGPGPEIIAQLAQAHQTHTYGSARGVQAAERLHP